MNKAITNINGELLTDDQLTQIYNLNKNRCRAIAEEAGAVYRFGKTRRTDKKIFDKYIREHYLVH